MFSKPNQKIVTDKLIREVQSNIRQPLPAFQRLMKHILNESSDLA